MLNFVILSVIMLCAVLYSVIILSFVMLRAVMLSVIPLNAEPPLKTQAADYRGARPFSQLAFSSTDILLRKERI
jgi:hypothetical protein